MERWLAPLSDGPRRVLGGKGPADVNPIDDDSSGLGDLETKHDGAQVIWVWEVYMSLTQPFSSHLAGALAHSPSAM